MNEFLLNHYSQQAIDTLQLLAQSGSSRKYYRFQFQNQSYILTKSENVEENKSFLYFTQHFSKIIKNLPKIESVSSDFQCYVQSDLGDLSLMNVLESDAHSAKNYYRKAIQNLVRMQILGDQGLDYTQCFSYPKFNYLLVLRDLFSFKNYFLNLLGIEFNHGKLLMDFERFAQDFQQIPYQYFVYRDFQSRNIMIHKDDAYFIDYQGGMKGPPMYDLVSLLWQAKANLPKHWKEEFYDLYVNEFIKVSQKDIETLCFKNAYELCLIERLLQVLGTYGFRGIYERKSHFLNSIAYGLGNLKEIQDLELLNHYPELKIVIQKLIEPEVFQKIKVKIDE